MICHTTSLPLPYNAVYLLCFGALPASLFQLLFNSLPYTKVPYWSAITLLAAGPVFLPVEWTPLSQLYHKAPVWKGEASPPLSTSVLDYVWPLHVIIQQSLYVKPVFLQNIAEHEIWYQHNEKVLQAAHRFVNIGFG